MTKMSISPK